MIGICGRARPGLQASAQTCEPRSVRARERRRGGTYAANAGFLRGIDDGGLVALLGGALHRDVQRRRVPGVASREANCDASCVCVCVSDGRRTEPAAGASGRPGAYVRSRSRASLGESTRCSFVCGSVTAGRASLTLENSNVNVRCARCSTGCAAGPSGREVSTWGAGRATKRVRALASYRDVLTPAVVLNVALDDQAFVLFGEDDAANGELDEAVERVELLPHELLFVEKRRDDWPTLLLRRELRPRKLCRRASGPAHRAAVGRTGYDRRGIPTARLGLRRAPSP